LKSFYDQNFHTLKHLDSQLNIHTDRFLKQELGPFAWAYDLYSFSQGTGVWLW